MLLPESTTSVSTTGPVGVGLGTEAVGVGVTGTEGVVDGLGVVDGVGVVDVEGVGVLEVDGVGVLDVDGVGLGDGSVPPAHMSAVTSSRATPSPLVSQLSSQFRPG